MRKFLTAGLMAAVAIVIISLAQKDASQTGAETLPVQLASQMLGAAPAVLAIVNKQGKCVRIHLRDGNVRACEDQPDWKSLTLEVDRGQYFRSESLD